MEEDYPKSKTLLLDSVDSRRCSLLGSNLGVVLVVRTPSLSPSPSRRVVVCRARRHRLRTRVAGFGSHRSNVTAVASVRGSPLSCRLVHRCFGSVLLPLSQFVAPQLSPSQQRRCCRIPSRGVAGSDAGQSFPSVGRSKRRRYACCRAAVFGALLSFSKARRRCVQVRRFQQTVAIQGPEASPLGPAIAVVPSMLLPRRQLRTGFRSRLSAISCQQPPKLTRTTPYCPVSVRAVPKHIRQPPKLPREAPQDKF